MAVKKQPDSGASELPEAAHDWFRQFLKHLELFMVETSQSLGPDSDSADHRLPDGRISSERVETQRLIPQLDLNSPRLIKWRVMWMVDSDRPTYSACESTAAR